MPRRESTTKGFRQTASLLTGNIRKAAETRGFAVSRLLTRWDEIVGPRIAAIARPVEITYGHGSLSATLTVLTTGPQAPMLEMQKDILREKVNAVYGYNAISRLRITQTAATGFAEAQAHFAGTKPRAVRPIDPEARSRANDMARSVDDAGLRAALEKLGQNILERARSD